MAEVVGYLDAHSGAVTAFATIGLLLVTVGYVVLTWRLVSESRIVRIAGTEPELIAYLLPSKQYVNIINFVIANAGGAPAKNVNFRIIAGPEVAGRTQLPTGADRAPFGFLPQGERIVTFFGMAPDLLSPIMLPPIDVQISYENLKGARRTRTYCLDVRPFLGLQSMGRPPEYESAEALKKIAEMLRQLPKSHRGLRVEIVEPD